jgi:hypothetical protein
MLTGRDCRTHRCRGNFSAAPYVVISVRWACLVAAAFLIAACRGTSAPGAATLASPTPSISNGFSPLPQPFRLFTHCGILTTYFAGRTFYLAELYPSRVAVPGNPGSPEVAGTMTLLSAHVAAFVDPAGGRILFVDQLPGALNTPYPFAVHVMSGGNQLSDEQFAGRHWHTVETLPGVTGPPYGNGQDRSTLVGGTFTIVDADDGVFRSQAGSVLHFTALPPAGCD